MFSDSLNQQAAVTQLFTVSVFNELAKKAASPRFSRLVQEIDFEGRERDGFLVGDAFDEAFSMLKKADFRNEYLYKGALVQKQLLGTHSLKTASVLSEFRIERSKADLVILNGSGTVYEIKSERDSLDRLRAQVASYRKVFDKVCVIAGANHSRKIEALIPDAVGIMTLSDRYQISTLRAAEPDKSELSSKAIFETLRTSEAVSVVQQLGIKVPDVSNALLRSEINYIFTSADVDIIYPIVLKTLKASRNQSMLSEFVQSLPASLGALGLTVKTNKIAQVRILKAMETPLSEAIGWGKS